MKLRLTHRRRGIAILASVAVIIALFPLQSYALFGFGDIVFDPSSYATLGTIYSSNVSNGVKMAEELIQMEKIYANALQVYQLATAMSQSFSGGHKADWAAVAQMAADDYTHDKYGEGHGWSSAVSGNPNQVPSAWQLSTVAVGNATNLGTETAGQSPALARLASVEAMDGSSMKCLQTVSQYRGNSLANQLGPILKLAIARADGTAGTNSQIEQLNILAAEHEQGNTESRAQGQINACLVEQQILANKIQRDNQAESINTFAKVSGLYSSNPTMLSGVGASMAADIQ